MVYLSRYDNIRRILLEDTRHGSAKIPPEFYLGQWIATNELSESRPLSEYREYLDQHGVEKEPGFVLFYENNNIDQRVDSLLTVIPGLVFEKEVKPGLLDEILHWLNPVNANQTIFIYRNTRFFPEKK